MIIDNGWSGVHLHVDANAILIASNAPDHAMHWSKLAAAQIADLVWLLAWLLGASVGMLALWLLWLLGATGGC